MGDAVMSKLRVLLTCSLFALATAHGAAAFEGDNTPYPAGSPGSNIAELPPIPGIFMLEQTSVTGGGALYDNNGERTSIPPFKLHSVANIPRILISYGIHLPGNGLLYSQIVPPIVFLNTEIFGQKQLARGMANLTLTPLIGSWRPLPNLTTTVGFDFILPTGAYSASKPSIATGYTTYSPVLALRYDVKDGIDIGASNRLLINTQDNRTGYQSGNAFVSDFLVAWNIGGFKLGAVGGFLQQYSDDKVGGVSVQPGGNRQETLQVGPNVTYNDVVGHFPLNIQANYQIGVIARNAVKSNTFWFNLGIPLYVPQPPPSLPPPAGPAGA
jgi:hypothetical protein